jgi:hypothetical protein
MVDLAPTTPGHRPTLPLPTKMQLTAPIQAGVLGAASAHTPEEATMGDRQKVFIRLAHLLKPSAREFLDNTTELAQGMKLADVGLMSTLDHIEATPLEDRGTNYGDFLTQTIDLAITTQEASRNYEGMEPTLLSMRSASRALRSPVDDILGGITLLRGIADRAAEWERRSTALLSATDV